MRIPRCITLVVLVVVRPASPPMASATPSGRLPPVLLDRSMTARTVHDQAMARLAYSDAEGGQDFDRTIAADDSGSAYEEALPLGEAPPAAEDDNASSSDSTCSWPRRSRFAECQATAGPRDDPLFLERVRPCGDYSSVCTDIPVIEANRDYPGGGVGALVPGQDYVVQFDVGLHPAVAKDILSRQLREVDSCVHCPTFSEVCLEVVVTGGAMWGDLGVGGLKSGSYDCMGVCGVGCAKPAGGFTTTRNDIGAFDCLKHDVCSAWKSKSTGRETTGFCHDPDCGDEAAQALFNCWRGFRLFGSLGGNGKGPFSEPAVCDKQTHGCWSHSGWFTQGRCKIFQGWGRGQGIPDAHPLRSPIQRL